MLGDDVERVADVNAHLLVFRRVVNAILADEKDAAVRIGLINANGSGGQRHAESGLFFVLKFVVDEHGIFAGRAGIHLAAVVVRLAIHDEMFFHGEARGVQHAELLGFLVEDAGAAIERIKVILGEAFLDSSAAAARFNHCFAQPDINPPFGSERDSARQPPAVASRF